MKVVDESAVKNAPEGFKFTPAKGFKLEGSDKPVFAISVSSYDCTGCGVCTQACIGKDKTDETKKAINMVPQEPIKVQEGKCWDFFVDLPEFDRTKINKSLVKQAMLLEPLFEFSGSCAGCGETAYVRLVSQLFGDRMIVANATGPTLRVAPPFTAVTSRPLRGQRTRKAAVPLGPTASSKTTPNSVSVCASLSRSIPSRLLASSKP